jgi:hypothetical protein
VLTLKGNAIEIEVGLNTSSAHFWIPKYISGLGTFLPELDFVSPGSSLLMPTHPDYLQIIDDSEGLYRYKGMLCNIRYDKDFNSTGKYYVIFKDPKTQMIAKRAQKRKASETEALISGLISKEERLPGHTIKGTLVAIAVIRENGEVTLTEAFPEVNDLSTKPYKVFGFIRDKYNLIDYRFPLAFLTSSI